MIQVNALLSIEEKDPKEILLNQGCVMRSNSSLFANHYNTIVILVVPELLGISR